MREVAGTPQQRGQIVGQRVFRARHTRARDQIKETGGARRNFLQTFVGGSRRRKENRIETARLKDAAIVLGLFRREIGDQNAVGASLRCGVSKFFQPQLKNGIEIAEQNQRHLARLADATHKIKNTASVAPDFRARSEAR